LISHINNYKLYEYIFYEYRFENKRLSKSKNEINIIKSKLMAKECELEYLQKKFDKLFTEKQKNISLTRMSKYLEKIGNNYITNCNIQCILQIITVP